MKKIILLSFVLLNTSGLLISQPHEVPTAASVFPCNHYPIYPWQYCPQCNSNPCTPPVAPAATAASKKTDAGILPYLPHVFVGMVFDGMVIRPHECRLKKYFEEHSWDSDIKNELKIARCVRVGFYMLVAYKAGKTVRAYLQNKDN